MRRIFVLLLSVLLVLGGSAQFFGGAAARDHHGKGRGALKPDAIRPAAATDNGDVTDWYIVEVGRRGANPGDVADRLTQSLGIVVSHVYRHGFVGFAANIPPDKLAAVRAAKNVRSVEPDEPVQVDGTPSSEPFEPCSEAGDAGTQVVPTGICRIQADKNATAQIDGVDQRVDADVAVVDTGIDQTAADWDLNVQGGIDCTGGNDFMRDGFGHGTHVAGTLGALDNHVGVVGVAPGVRIWSVKVFNDDGKGSVRNILCGLDWVRAQEDNGVKMDVVNMSLSTSPKKKKIDDRHCGKRAHDDFQKGICKVVKAG
ncbi:MAG TPA: S8 family serine peptidase, partial [Thermomicrobiales bacterium]|nr:S8 family serine peptidase [Thermomicrobiales bacterium]